MFLIYSSIVLHSSLLFFILQLFYNSFFIFIAITLSTKSQSYYLCVWKKLEPKGIMEEVADIVIVGAGIAGLTTSLGLHRFACLVFVCLCVCIFWSVEILENKDLKYITVLQTWNQKLSFGIIRDFEDHRICHRNMDKWLEGPRCCWHWWLPSTAA